MNKKEKDLIKEALNITTTPECSEFYNGFHSAVNYIENQLKEVLE